MLKTMYHCLSCGSVILTFELLLATYAAENASSYEKFCSQMVYAL